MIVTIMQPAYLPWLGYFERIALSDRFILLDHVQIDANSKTKFANRNRIRTPQGWSWLTIPLKTKGLRDQLFLNALETASDVPWEQKHWLTLKANYTRAPHFSRFKDHVAGLYARHWPFLRDAAADTLQWQLEALGIQTPTLRSSEMGAAGAKDELILNLCKAAGATTYLSGPHGRDYLDESAFAAAGIRVVYHDYVHPVYTQAFPGFEPYMAAVDLLFNHGPESAQILKTWPGLRLD